MENKNVAIVCSCIFHILVKFMGVADADDLVQVLNTTSGIMAILRSLMFKARDQILYLATIFSSMQSQIEYIVDTNKGVNTLEFNYTYPITNDQLVSKLDQFLQQHSKNPIKIAVIDHITSAPNVLLPLDKIIPLLKKRNILVLIDGAQAVGPVPINMKKLDPDFYVGDTHKWLYTGRGSAVVYVKKEHQKFIHPTSISEAYSKSAEYQGEFSWTGVMDYTVYLSVTAAIKCRETIGGEEAIRKYTHNLAVEGGKCTC